MNHYFITGTSRGIGKALATELLKDETNFVTGISRTSSIEHSNYIHVPLDLSIPGNIEKVDFTIFAKTKNVSLVNNSGVLGDIKYLGTLSDQTIIDTINLNFTSVALLCNSFIKKFHGFDGEKMIMNIGSGAGTSPVDGWSNYCTTKAALHMLTDVITLENKKKGVSNFKVYTISPGVVDTNMQDEMRKVSKENFSRVQEFIDFKEQGILNDPNVIARKINYVINNKNSFPDVSVSLKNVEV
ncbi:MAG: SDR family NAD(P)-dependent oxidoreductase [Bacteroidia bacterium]|nr:SDR family NAD(P)-dependent oxidoreductase [Bacteroidia bacterium]